MRRISQNSNDTLAPAVHCHRCGGLMVEDSCYSNAGYSVGSRCIQCGDVVDPVILKHRIAPPAYPTRHRDRTMRRVRTSTAA